MKTFVLVVLMVINGETTVTHEVVPDCPNYDILSAAMELEKIHGKFEAWSAACLMFDLNQ